MYIIRKLENFVKDHSLVFGKRETEFLMLMLRSCCQYQLQQNQLQEQIWHAERTTDKILKEVKSPPDGSHLTYHMSWGGSCISSFNTVILAKRQMFSSCEYQFMLNWKVSWWLKRKKKKTRDSLQVQCFQIHYKSNYPFWIVLFHVY